MVMCGCANLLERCGVHAQPQPGRLLRRRLRRRPVLSRLDLSLVHGKVLLPLCQEPDQVQRVVGRARPAELGLQFECRASGQLGKVDWVWGACPDRIAGAMMGSKGWGRGAP